jgi:hypothetical protein
MTTSIHREISTIFLTPLPPTNPTVFRQFGGAWDGTGTLWLPPSTGSSGAIGTAAIRSGAVKGAGDIEDRIVVTAPRIAALDACSSTYLSGTPRRVVGDQSDGSWAAETIAWHLHRNPEVCLADRLNQANAALGQELLAKGYEMKPAGLLPAVSGAAIQFGDTSLTGCQWGDGVLVFKLRSGPLVTFASQSHPQEQRERSQATEILREVGGNRGKMWDCFAPILLDARNSVTTTLKAHSDTEISTANHQPLISSKRSRCHWMTSSGCSWPLMDVSRSERAQPHKRWRATLRDGGGTWRGIRAHSGC